MTPRNSARPADSDGHRDARERISPRGNATQQLGGILARARKGRFTLEELALASGLSTGLISQIERGLGNPSFTTLLKLANALQVPWHDLFTGPVSETPGLVRASARKRLVLPDEDLTYELLTPDFQGDLVVLRAHIPAHFDNTTRPFRHPGEECVHLLSGNLHVLVGAQMIELATGDSLTYDSGMPHGWRNPDPTPAELLSAVTPVTF
jgi:transcriptional regulator with XRE-family HTH domain